MKPVEKSAYIARIRPVAEKLLKGLLETYAYASVLVTDANAKQYSVSKSGTQIRTTTTFGDKGMVVKVYDGHSYAEYATNQVDEDRLPAIMQEIQMRLVPWAEACPPTIAQSEYDALPDEVITLSKATSYEIHPQTLGDDGIIAKLEIVKNKALAYDSRIVDAPAFATYQEYHKLFLSKNKDMEQSVLWMTSGMSVMASAGEELKNYYKSYSCLGGAEVLDAMEEDILNVAKIAVDLLSSEPMQPGLYDCICTPEVTGMIVHEAFGHGVEMDMFVKDRALAASYIGKYVASPLVTMHDGASAARETATFFFDDEGILAQDTVVIDKGVLVRGISDAQSAMHLGTTPTGNGRRESYERKAYTRMTNTYFEGGHDTLEDMIASISYGMLLENATSGMEDPKNWGIQCMVNIAREIKDGQLTGRIFSPVVLTGYVPDLLCSISMMSPTVELGGGGACGKGYKEWVKVSDGGPYIKAKIRLG